MNTSQSSDIDKLKNLVIKYNTIEINSRKEIAKQIFEIMNVYYQKDYLAIPNSKKVLKFSQQKINQMISYIQPQYHHLIQFILSNFILIQYSEIYAYFLSHIQKLNKSKRYILISYNVIKKKKSNTMLNLFYLKFLLDANINIIKIINVKNWNGSNHTPEYIINEIEYALDTLYYTLMI